MGLSPQPGKETRSSTATTSKQLCVTPEGETFPPEGAGVERGGLQIATVITQRTCLLPHYCPFPPNGVIRVFISNESETGVETIL